MKFNWPFKKKKDTEIYNDYPQKNIAREININNYFSPLMAIRNLLSNNKFSDVLSEMQLIEEEIFRSHPKYPYYGYKRMNVGGESLLRSIPNNKVVIPEEMKLSYRGTLKILDTDLHKANSLNDYLTRKSVLNQPIKIEITSFDEVIGKEVLINDQGISKLFDGVVNSEMRVGNFEEIVYSKLEGKGKENKTIIDYLPLKRTDYNYEENYIEISNSFDEASDVIVKLKTPLDKVMHPNRVNKADLTVNISIKQGKETDLSSNILYVKYMYDLSNAHTIRFTDLKNRIPLIEAGNFNFTEMEKSDLLLIMQSFEKLRELESKYKIKFIVGDIDNKVMEKIDLIMNAYEEVGHDVKFNNLSTEFVREDIQNLYERKGEFLDQNIQLSFEDSEDSIIELWGYKFILKRKYHIDNIRLSKEEIENKLKVTEDIIKLNFIQSKDSIGQGHTTIHSVLKV